MQPFTQIRERRRMAPLRIEKRESRFVKREKEKREIYRICLSWMTSEIPDLALKITRDNHLKNEVFCLMFKQTVEILRKKVYKLLSPAVFGLS